MFFHEEKMGTKDTRNQILDLAENLIMSRGYNGFSYKDISTALNIKNAAIHYHFPAKKDLGLAVIQRTKDYYLEWARIVAVDQVPHLDVLDQFFAIYQHYMESDHNICLGGALETDFYTLPEEMQQAVQDYVAELIQWMAEFLSEGRKQGVFSFRGSPESKALLILSSLQGVVQMARVHDEDLFDLVVNQIKENLGL